MLTDNVLMSRLPQSHSGIAKPHHLNLRSVMQDCFCFISWYYLLDFPKDAFFLEKKFLCNYHFLFALNILKIYIFFSIIFNARLTKFK